MSANLPTLLAIAPFAQQLDVSFGIAPAKTNRNDVIKLKALLASTLHAFAFVALPYEQSRRLRNTLATRRRKFLHILKRLEFAANTIEGVCFL